MTKYLIFNQVGEVDEEGTWVEVALVEARSTQAAVRSYLDGSEGNGRYVAIPARSFKPVTVTTETKTTLKFA